MKDVGCILDSSRGRYQPYDILEIAMQHGYNCEYIDAIVEIFDKGCTIVDASIDYVYDNAREYVCDKWEWIYEEVESAISWMNDNADLPAGCMFEINPNSGDFGMYYYGVNYQQVVETDTLTYYEGMILESMLNKGDILKEDSLDEYSEGDIICIVGDNDYPTIEEIIQKVRDFIDNEKEEEEEGEA